MADTLYLTINIADRYLSSRPCARSELQLVGITSLFIACKYEELQPPDVKDFVYVTDKAFTREQILDLEVKILNALDWRVTVPSALTFLRRYAKVLDLKKRHQVLAQYFLELSLPVESFLRYAPSYVACAALVLANKVLGTRPSFPPAVSRLTPYDERGVKDVAREIVAILQDNPSTMQAARKKFSTSAYMGVAKLLTRD